ncbi:uncharacterized protein LOC125233089 [Leguminivora glycinivorella]|uniref:uncharacterized protein LOC125233089 n=1 Tax=Leguminivora glycinivorella TaxID=1035111 RepID=UPI00200ED38B|nr:uncharacterized protein LOC125233089 [Leguminivora glycinivorella]
MKILKTNKIFVLGIKNNDIQDSRHLYKQVLATVASCLLYLSAGLTNGISAVLLPELAQDSSLSWGSELGSWIASLAPISSILGCVCVGTLLDSLGRRIVHIILAFPFMVGWLVMAFADDFSTMMVGRFLTGLSFGAIRPTAIIYLGEISDPKYRGIILLFPSVALTLGVLLSHVIALFLLYISIASAIASLGWSFIAELYPTKVRGVGSGLVRNIPIDWTLEDLVNCVDCPTGIKVIKARRLNRKIIDDGVTKWIPTQKTVFTPRRPPPSPGKSYDRSAHDNITRTPSPSQGNGCCLNNDYTPNDNILNILMAALMDLIRRWSDGLPNNVFTMVEQLTSLVNSCKNGYYGDPSMEC